MHLIIKNHVCYNIMSVTASLITTYKRYALVVITLCDITVLANRGMRRCAELGLDIEVFLIGYADDVSALVIGDNEDEVQTGIDIMEEEFAEYFSSAGLAMNKDKSEVIMFRSHRPTRVITIGDQEEACHVKLLGVTVEKGFKFNKHASNFGFQR